MIFGIDKSDTGVLELEGEKITAMYPQKAIKRGLGFCPEDRKVEGIVGELTIRENIALAMQAKKDGSLSFRSKSKEMWLRSTLICSTSKRLARSKGSIT